MEMIGDETMEIKPVDRGPSIIRRNKLVASRKTRVKTRNADENVTAATSNAADAAPSLLMPLLLMHCAHR